MELLVHNVSVFVQTNWIWINLAIIPISAALIGWITNMLAIWMTFYPLEFTGFGKVGWQGIIPSQSKRMASISVDLMVGKLLNIKAIFANIKAKEVTEQTIDFLQPISKKVMNEVLSEKVPLPWQFLNEDIKNYFFDRAACEIPTVIENSILDIQKNIETLFDVKPMIIEQLEKDKNLLNQIFLECGNQEFRFLERSGFYFGFCFGLIQMVIWYFARDFKFAWILLPVGGLLIGYLTNWLALKLIFRPLRPINLGLFKLQGLFLKRQKEVAATYANLVATKILTTENIFNAILNGRKKSLLNEIIKKNTEKGVDNITGIFRTIIQLIAGVNAYQSIKKTTTIAFQAVLPQMIEKTFSYTDEAIDMENTLNEKMANLSPEAFEGFLHPVFEADELKLLLVGGILGMFAGFLQLFLVV